MLEVSPFGVETLVRFERDAWQMVKLLGQVMDWYAPSPAPPSPSPPSALDSQQRVNQNPELIPRFENLLEEWCNQIEEYLNPRER